MNRAPQRASRARKQAGTNQSGAGHRRRWGGLVRAVGRAAVRAAVAPPRLLVRAWSRLRPAQQLAMGFASYAAIGTLALCLPFAKARDAALIDNLFNVVSAVSTTGLTTISVADSYTFFGELVILLLFQLGGVGYMTISSVLVLARGGRISDARMGVLRAGFALPHYFVMHRFLVHVVVFTVVSEFLGSMLLWWRFSALGVEHPLWSAVFHSVSAFATAGFSLNNTSLEAFAADPVVNLVIGALAYMGAMGFIVVQDVWYSVKLRERMLTFTSKVILWMTGAVFVVGAALLFFMEPGIRALPLGERAMASAFQMMTASTTAGFNTIPISTMSTAALLVIMAAMLIGASPSGTGGGVKTTTVSALLANLFSVLRGRERIVLLGHEIPMARVLFAFAAATFYLGHLAAGTVILALTERQAFLPIAFEAASALGTVGLSMGITGDLSPLGKIIVIYLMFAGRCGPLTIGLALLRPQAAAATARGDDLAV